MNEDLKLKEEKEQRIASAAFLTAPDNEQEE